MKITVKHILVLLGVCAMLPICEAQNTVVRRSSTATNRTDKNGLYGKSKNTVRRPVNLPKPIYPGLAVSTGKST